MKVTENFSLKNHNTFGINVSCRYFVECFSIDDFLSLLSDKQYFSLPKLILGGGSNILFTKNFDGIIIKNSMKGIEVIKEDDDDVLVKSGAGEVWHDLVLFCLKNNFGGIENLSLIPGTVGAAPIQNIGAYGVELKEVFFELEAIDIDSRNLKTFSSEDCGFGYRDSVFKNELKNKFIIANVTLKLNKHHHFNVSYGAIKDELKNKEVTIQNISEAVCKIRMSKLPNPAEIGNAGSFFKNPVISKEKFELLKNEFPGISFYPAENNRMKLAAGWLIEQCGWKGKITGQTGVHKNQALVLVNYGNANGDEIFQLSEEIKKSVKEKFGVELETEVNII